MATFFMPFMPFMESDFDSFRLLRNDGTRLEHGHVGDGRDIVVVRVVGDDLALFFSGEVLFDQVENVGDDDVLF